MERPIFPIRGNKIWIGARRDRREGIGAPVPGGNGDMPAVGAGPGSRWQQSCYVSDPGRRSESPAGRKDHRAVRNTSAKDRTAASPIAPKTVR